MIVKRLMSGEERFISKKCKTLFERQKWHVIFEERYPKDHEDFLESLIREY